MVVCVYVWFYILLLLVIVYGVCGAVSWTLKFNVNKYKFLEVSKSLFFRKQHSQETGKIFFFILYQDVVFQQKLNDFS